MEKEKRRKNEGENNNFIKKTFLTNPRKKITNTNKKT
jgi:hypothetical protein